MSSPRAYHVIGRVNLIERSPANDLTSMAVSSLPDAPGHAPELNPETLSDDLVVSEPEHVAAGMPAVVSAMKHAVREMGPVRGTRELFMLNQFQGFDCPGCAWPDPHDHRSVQEYCENGAKAVAEEATTARVTPEFFADHAIDELAAHDDFWIGKRGRL